MSESILEITPPPTFPFDPDEKMFYPTDQDGNVIGEPYSYNDWTKQIMDISGISKELCGE